MDWGKTLPSLPDCKHPVQGWSFVSRSNYFSMHDKRGYALPKTFSTFIIRTQTRWNHPQIIAIFLVVRLVLC